MRLLLLATAILVLQISVPAEARTRRKQYVPLLPSRVQYTHSDAYARPRVRPYWDWGVELGTIARRSNAGADVLGMDLIPGGRVFTRHVLSPHWILKPSLGYFRGSSGEAESSVAQNVFEAGVAFQYSPNRQKERLQWYVGVSSRLEMIMSQISVMSATETTSKAFRARLGPTAGFYAYITPDLGFVGDFEIAASVTSPVRIYSGLTFGFAFRIR